MFGNCNNLDNIQINNFEVKNVKSMLGMFEKCTNLASLDISNFDTQNLEEISYFLSNCKKLEYLDMSKFKTTEKIKYENIFENISETGTLICNDNNIIDIMKELHGGWTIKKSEN